MNRQVNPDHCYVTDDGVVYRLAPVHGTPEWWVMKDGRHHRIFTSLMAAPRAGSNMSSSLQPPTGGRHERIARLRRLEDR